MKGLTSGIRRMAAAALASLCAVGGFSDDVAEKPFGMPDLSPWLGIYIADLSSGEVVTERNADRLYTPASVTKALTSAAVLSLRDSDERFVTRVELVGSADREGVFHGDIVVKAAADPTLGSWRFKEAAAFAASVAEAVERAGIKRLEGGVRVDSKGLTGFDVPPGWTDDDLRETYGAPLMALNYAGNIATRTETVVKGRGRRAKKTTVKKNVVDMRPDTTLAAAVGRALEARGIESGGACGKGGRTSLLMEQRSPRYADILADLMFRSDNLMAEGMLRTLAPGESREEALLEEALTWEDMGIVVPDNMTVTDGSGLSRLNRLTPRFLGSVLRAMAGSSVAPTYLRLFPRAGRQGTVRSFLAGTPLEGRLALKTGSLNGVQCYAGYAYADESSPGRPTHVVVIMANGFPGSRAALKKALADMLLDIFAPPEAEETTSETKK